MKAVVASHNKHKLAELQRLLSQHIPGIELLSLSDVGIFGDIVEDGETFADNALIKAKAAAASGYIGIGDDSGLCVDALGGAPGVYSARYAGPACDDAANNAKLLAELEKAESRAASFVCTIACVFPDGSEPIVVSGETCGEILTELRGRIGFGYDPLFYVKEKGLTFAEMEPDEKNAVSHRGRAIEKLAVALAERLK